MPDGPGLEVLRPGLQTTVQGAGRCARALGVPEGGAADTVALRLANALVGNPPDAAGLEVTLTGPTLRFRADALVALCGAPFESRLDGQPFPLNRAVRVEAGQTLSIGGTPRGARAILVFRGGLHGQEVFGRRSTDLRSGFGGLEGRALRAGDHLTWSSLPPATPPRAFLSPDLLTPTGPDVTLRALSTPEATPDLLAALLRLPFAVSRQVDRMGARLDGQITAPYDPARVSLPNVPGAVQLPPDGRPILLLPDAGTHGGYPTPVVVASVDLPRLGQLRAGDRVRLRAVDLDEARTALREQERALWQAEAALRWWYSGQR
ncbi:biotin-dependent carboxyltransferase family protein [Deinococcus hopiensis]|uniref:Antagonist of KipI n=1 Tax=Deinococcus hopiensis KR-140 TaxID=695939 RepID=A0A1W1VP63_9DEIO|nr:biotin-dependent carboxyltransferase family protein [Deinococcus hopiensis]SMB95149.1 antagonist of KipI [Deinococcus hopiensis KR-140]